MRRSVLLLLLASLLVEVVGFCPEDCICNDTLLTVHCIRTDLQVRHHYRG